MCVYKKLKFIGEGWTGLELRVMMGWDRKSDGTCTYIHGQWDAERDFALYTQVRPASSLIRLWSAYIFRLNLRLQLPFQKLGINVARKIYPNSI